MAAFRRQNLDVNFSMIKLFWNSAALINTGKVGMKCFAIIRNRLRAGQ